MSKLYRKLEDVLNWAKGFGPDDVDLAKMALGAMEESGLSTMTLVLHIAELQKKKAEKIETEYRIALDSACNALSSVAKKILEKGSGQPRSFMTGVLFNPESIAHVAYFLKMWVPNPEKGGFSGTSEWMVDRTLEVFDLEHYMPGGSSHEWAKQYQLFDYISKLKAIKESRVGGK